MQFLLDRAVVAGTGPPGAGFALPGPGAQRRQSVKRRLASRGGLRSDRLVRPG